LASITEGEPKSTVDGIAIEIAEAGGGLARKKEDEENGSTAVRIPDSSPENLLS